MITQPPGHQRSRELNSGAPAGYRRRLPITRELPDRSKALPSLYAVIGTWFEADIIEAAVKNCFANGCSKVYLVDNDSPDATRELALEAGAVLGRNYKTTFYDDDLRLRLMNDVMQEVTEKERQSELWWLSLDADEFPCGPRGERIIDWLAQLNDAYNCVGANAIDLYPTTQPHYEYGKHPADFQSEGVMRRAAKGLYCQKAHWKHPLLKTLHGQYDVAQSRGSHTTHTARANVVTAEPVEELIIFHAPFRKKEDAWNRLNALCSKNPTLGNLHRSAGDDIVTGNHGAITRWRSIEAVYNGWWDKVEMAHSQQFGRHIVGVSPYPWRHLLRGRIVDFPRWYPPPEIGGTFKKVGLSVIDNP